MLKIKKRLGIFLAVYFVMSVTVALVSAALDNTYIKDDGKNPDYKFLIVDCGR